MDKAPAVAAKEVANHHGGLREKTSRPQCDSDPSGNSERGVFEVRSLQNA